MAEFDISPEAKQAIETLVNGPYWADFSIQYAVPTHSGQWQAFFSLWSQSRHDHYRVSREHEDVSEAILLAARDVSAEIRANPPTEFGPAPQRLRMREEHAALVELLGGPQDRG